VEFDVYMSTIARQGVIGQLLASVDERGVVGKRVPWPFYVKTGGQIARVVAISPYCQSVLWDHDERAYQQSEYAYGQKDGDFHLHTSRVDSERAWYNIA